MSIKAQAYVSPTLVLLALDWPEGEDVQDFLGFAIKRTPGFLAADGQSREAESWLPNRLTFDGPVPEGKPDVPSNLAPVQKFQWWDARIEPGDRSKSFTYSIFPVTGKPGHLKLGAASELQVTLPHHIEDSIGTWFNRAVLSSQGFERKLKAMGVGANDSLSKAQALVLREWLSNDLEKVFGEIFKDATDAVCAIYHLTDKLWAIPAFKAFGKVAGHNLAVVYDDHGIKHSNGTVTPTPNQQVVDQLSNAQTKFHPRDKTSIMHNKFIVTDSPRQPGIPQRVVAGSANFTTGGLTEQANLLHLFDSPELAAIYDHRARAISDNPAKAKTAQITPGWSEEIAVGTATVRVNFSPEGTGKRTQIDTVVQAVGQAKSSVLFCIFTPTDKELRHACFDAGERGLMMYGLVNNISEKSAAKAAAAEAPGKVLNSQELASLELYHRSKEEKDVIDGSYFSRSTVPDGFDVERTYFPGEQDSEDGDEDEGGNSNIPPVVIHHKFVIIDAETANPIVYTGSANMSENSEHNNDENLLEIRDKRIARIYLAEFMRLYEHYRARALYIKQKAGAKQGAPHGANKLQLQPDARWAKKYFSDGSPELRARIAMAKDS